MKINFGCGKKKIKGWINVDVSSKVKPDKVLDLNNLPLPFKDNSCDEILCRHTLEHLDKPLEFVEECHRILNKDGKLMIICPYFAHHTAYRPTHKTFWNYSSLDFFDENHEKEYYTKTRFKIKKRIIFSRTFGLNLINKIININPLWYEILFCWILPAREIKYEMIKGVKNE